MEGQLDSGEIGWLQVTMETLSLFRSATSLVEVVLGPLHGLSVVDSQSAESWTRQRVPLRKRSRTVDACGQFLCEI